MYSVCCSKVRLLCSDSGTNWMNCCICPFFSFVFTHQHSRVFSKGCKQMPHVSKFLSHWSEILHFVLFLFDVTFCLIWKISSIIFHRIQMKNMHPHHLAHCWYISLFTTFWSIQPSSGTSTRRCCWWSNQRTTAISCSGEWNTWSDFILHGALQLHPFHSECWNFERMLEKTSGALRHRCIHVQWPLNKSHLCSLTGVIRIQYDR